tara:strand:- start:2512 stop:2829 length:318 start_codon:yes stop_codon:yes gene_type:complete
MNQPLNAWRCSIWKLEGGADRENVGVVECVIVGLAGLSLATVVQFDFPSHHDVRPVEVQGCVVVHQAGSGVGQRLQNFPIAIVGGQFYRVPPTTAAERTDSLHPG